MAYQPHQPNIYVNQNNAQGLPPSQEERGRRSMNGQDMSYGYAPSPMLHPSHARQGYNSLPDTRQMPPNQHWQNDHGYQPYHAGQHQSFANHALQPQWSYTQPSGQQFYGQQMPHQQQSAPNWPYAMSQPVTGDNGYAFQHPMSQPSIFPVHSEHHDVNTAANFARFQQNHSPSLVPDMGAMQPINTSMNGNLSSNASNEVYRRQSQQGQDGRGHLGDRPGLDAYSNATTAHETKATPSSMVPVSMNKHVSALSNNHTPVHSSNHIPSKHTPVSADQHASQTRDTFHISQKRRKSNEGIAIPAPQQQPPSHPVHQPKSSAKSVSSSSPLPQLKSTQASQAPLPDQDLSEVLLALADEYVNAAHSMSPDLSDANTNEDDLRQYQRLIATAVSCLDSVLNNYRYPNQRKAALIRLRLASLLLEETHDANIAEEILSKGMALCDSSRLYDLKYAMQHMYIRNLHNANAKAALKALDKAIKEAEGLRLVHWQYAFHLLNVSLCLQSGGFSDLAAAHKHLRLVGQLADGLGDTSVKIISSALEAICHFRGGTTDDFGSAAYATATANGFQLSPEMKAMPQAQALVNCLNMINSVPRFSSDAMFTAMKQMHPEQNTLSKAKEWTKDGCFAIPLLTDRTPHVVSDSYGVFVSSNDRLALNVKWMTSADMMILCYMLSGIGSIPKNGERYEAERFFTQALKINDHRFAKRNASLHALVEEDMRRRQVGESIKYLLACALAGRAQYTEALKIIKGLWPNSTATSRGFLQEKLRFVRGICEQGLGHLDAALELFRIDVAHLQPDAKTQPMLKDLFILSTLNSIHILHQLNRPDSEIEFLLDLLESHCLDHVNRNFAAAYHVVVATIGFSTSTIIDTKNRLSHALQPAQAAENQQLLAIIMNMMTEIFFTDIVGAQAQKSAHAAHTIAAKSGDPLWTAVGLGMYRETLDRMGETHKAAEMDVLMQKAVSAMPPNVQRALNLT